VLDFQIQIAPLTKHDHLCEAKFIEIALSLRRAGRHPGLPTKLICRNTRVHRKNIAPNKESNSNARQDLELTASLSSSRKPSRHLSYTRKIALSNSMLVSLRQSKKRRVVAKFDGLLLIAGNRPRVEPRSHSLPKTIDFMDELLIFLLFPSICLTFEQTEEAIFQADGEIIAKIVIGSDPIDPISDH
jgi:hypothetical protein